jgi:hypothetical protein
MSMHANPLWKVKLVQPSLYSTIQYKIHRGFMYIYILNTDANSITFNTSHNSQLLPEYMFLIISKDRHQV